MLLRRAMGTAAGARAAPAGAARVFSALSCLGPTENSSELPDWPGWGLFTVDRGYPDTTRYPGKTFMWMEKRQKPTIGLENFLPLGSLPVAETCHFSDGSGVEHDHVWPNWAPKTDP